MSMVYRNVYINAINELIHTLKSTDWIRIIGSLIDFRCFISAINVQLLGAVQQKKWLTFENSAKFQENLK